MHIELDFWGFCFGISLFILFLYKVIDLVLGRLLPLLSNKQKEIIDNQTEILEREELLSATRKKIEKKIIDQKRQFIELESNMRVLRDYLLAKCERERKECEEFGKIFLTRREKQLKHQERVELFRSAIPLVLKKTEMELKQITKNNTNQAFLQDLISKK